LKKKYLNGRNCELFSVDFKLQSEIEVKMNRKTYFFAFTFIGLAAAVSIEPRNFSSEHLEKVKPFSSRNIDCSQYPDKTVFPDIHDCYRYLICDGGELFHEFCPEGHIFNRDENLCDDPDYYDVECINDPEYDDYDERCPPPGSNDLVFLPSMYCDEFKICINGFPVIVMCRPGLHWNKEEGLDSLWGCSQRTSFRGGGVRPLHTNVARRPL
jgi:hypothetical protein